MYKLMMIAIIFISNCFGLREILVVRIGKVEILCKFVSILTKLLLIVLYGLIYIKVVMAMM